MDDISVVLSAVEREVSASSAGSPPFEGPISQWLSNQLEQSQSDPTQLAMWTSSTVVDGNAESPLLNPRVFGWLHRGLPEAYEYPIGHAGLMHTYGYLLSPVVTPYGVKRERWLSSDLADAFGLKPWFFHPTASTVPLMERVAYVVLPTLIDPAGTERAVLALDEVVDEGRPMRTVFVSNADRTATAAIYGSVTDGIARIVSAFPVQGFTAEFALERLTGPTRYRYNYAPPGELPGSGFGGKPEVLFDVP